MFEQSTTELGNKKGMATILTLEGMHILISKTTQIDLQQGQNELSCEGLMHFMIIQRPVVNAVIQ